MGAGKWMWKGDLDRKQEKILLVHPFRLHPEFRWRILEKGTLDRVALAVVDADADAWEHN
jgi:hypothetical protein